MDLPTDTNHFAWYLAWHPDFSIGVVRAKDAAGLEEWRSRRWQVFRHVEPRITDISAHMGRVSAAFALPPSHSPHPLPRVVGVLRGEDPALELRWGESHELAPGEINVDPWFRQTWNDLRKKTWILGHPGPKGPKACWRESEAGLEPELRISAWCEHCRRIFSQPTTRHAVRAAYAEAASRMDGNLFEQIAGELAMFRALAADCGVDPQDLSS